MHPRGCTDHTCVHEVLAGSLPVLSCIPLLQGILRQGRCCLAPHLGMRRICCRPVRHRASVLGAAAAPVPDLCVRHVPLQRPPCWCVSFEKGTPALLPAPGMRFKAQSSERRQANLLAEAWCLHQPLLSAPATACESQARALFTMRKALVCSPVPMC